MILIPFQQRITLLPLHTGNAVWPQLEELLFSMYCNVKSGVFWHHQTKDVKIARRVDNRPELVHTWQIPNLQNFYLPFSAY